MSEDILRAGPFAEDDPPSGARVQTPGAVCFHSTQSFGFMVRDYEPAAANALWGIHPIYRFIQPHDSFIEFMASFGGMKHPEAAPEFDVQHETKADRVVTTICGGVAKTSAGRTAGEFAAGA